MRALLVGVGAVALAAACGGQDRREAEGVSNVVNLYRRADNGGKPAAVEAIRSAPCHAQDVCQARDTCLASADATVKALKLKTEVERGLAKVERGEVTKDSDEALGLAAKLDEAESLLKEGFDRLQPCDDQLLALKRKYAF